MKKELPISTISHARSWHAHYAPLRPPLSVSPIDTVTPMVGRALCCRGGTTTIVLVEALKEATETLKAQCDLAEG